MQTHKCENLIKLAYVKGIQPKLIFDLGSYDCEQAVELATAWPEAKVIAVEADPWNLIQMRDNADRSGFNIEPLCMALATHTGLTRFARAIGDNDECGSRLSPNGLYPDAMPTESITAPCITSADLVAYYGVPDLVWMDVQGSEWDFFACLPANARPALIWMEVALKQYYHGQPLGSELHGPIERLGYRRIHVEPASAWFEDWCYQFCP